MAVTGSDGRPAASLAPYTRVTLRAVGSPLPLALLALTCAGMLLSLEQIGALAPTEQPVRAAAPLRGSV